MLRLEKHREQIRLYLKEKESLFTGHFARAFLIASLFHLIAFFLFNIHSLFLHEGPNLPSVIVNAMIDQNDNAQVATSQYSEEDPYYLYFLADLFPVPKITMNEVYLMNEENHREGILGVFDAIEENWDSLFLASQVEQEKVVKPLLLGELSQLTVEGGLEEIAGYFLTSTQQNPKIDLYDGVISD